MKEYKCFTLGNILGIVFGVAAFSFVQSQDVSDFSTLSCDALSSCSPSSCVTSSDVDCTISTNTPDFVTTIANMSCNSECTQSSNGKCSVTYLKSVFKSDAGIKAAYCNDIFLVIWSTSKPRQVVTFIHIFISHQHILLWHAIALTSPSFNGNYDMLV